VQVLLDGRDELGTVSTKFSEDGRPVLEWPAPQLPALEHPCIIELTDEDVAAFRRKGQNLIFSKIRLSTEGGASPIERIFIPPHFDIKA